MYCTPKPIFLFTTRVFRRPPFPFLFERVVQLGLQVQVGQDVAEGLHLHKVDACTNRGSTICIQNTSNVVACPPHDGANAGPVEDITGRHVQRDLGPFRSISDPVFHPASSDGFT